MRPPLPQAGPALPDRITVHRHRSVRELAYAMGPVQAHGTAGDVFYTLPWFDNLERHGVSAAGSTLGLLVRGSGSAPPAGLLLRTQDRGPAAPYGSVLTGLSTYYSSLFGPTPDAGALSIDACRAVVRFLRRQPDLPAVIDLQPLDRDSVFFAHWQQALREQGFLVSSYFCFGNWYLEVGGRSFDAYYPSVPSRIRNTVRRARKKLDDQGDWGLRVFTGDDPDLEVAIADFDAVYRKSWKVPEPYPDFVPGLIRTAAGEGWLRLGVLRVGTVPVAAQLWLVRDRRALIYKLAYDEAHRRLSAGSVLTAELFRQSIDQDQVIEIDYLTGDDAYKADWMSHRRERMGLVAFDPRRIQGAVAALRHHAARRWRAWFPTTPAPVKEAD